MRFITKLAVIPLAAAVGASCALITDIDANVLSGHWVSVPGGSVPWVIDLRLTQAADGTVEGSGRLTPHTLAYAVTVTGTFDHPMLRLELRQDTLVARGLATINRRDDMSLSVSFANHSENGDVLLHRQPER